MGRTKENRDYASSPIGDEAIFASLLQEAAPQIMQLLLFRTSGNQHLAEECLQLASIHAWLRRDTFQPKESQSLSHAFTRWMGGICAKEVADQHRNSQRAHAASLEALEELGVQAFYTNLQPGSSVPYEDALDLQAAMQELPPLLQAAVDLRYFQGLSSAETAEQLGKSARAVDTMTWRARTTLAEQMDVTD